MRDNNSKSLRIDELLTVEEVAAKLKVSVRTVRDWRYRRRLPFTRIARRLYVPVGAVEAMLKRNSIVVLGNRKDHEPAGQGGEQPGDVHE